MRHENHEICTTDAGQALIEFLIAFPIALALIITCIQGALMYNGKHVAQLAAFRAAHTAALRIPADARQVGGEGPNELFVDMSDPKYRAIVQAATLTAAAISPPWSMVFEGAAPSDETEQALVGVPLPEPPSAWSERHDYARAATRVSLYEIPAGDGAARELVLGERYRLEGDSDIAVELTHRFYLVFPLNGLTPFGEVWGEGVVQVSGGSYVSPALGSARYIPARARAILPLEGWTLPR